MSEPRLWLYDPKRRRHAPIAITQFDKACRLFPIRCNRSLDRGSALKERSRLDEASSRDSIKQQVLLRTFRWSGIIEQTSILRSKTIIQHLMITIAPSKSTPTIQMHGLVVGNAFTGLKRYDEAFAAYDKAVALKPDLAGAWFGRGNAFTALKRYDEAFAAYDKAQPPDSNLTEQKHGLLVGMSLTI